MIWIHPDNIESGEKMSVSAILKFATASLSDIRPTICANFRSIACRLRSGRAFLYGKNSSALLLRFAILKCATGSSE